MTVPRRWLVHVAVALAAAVLSAIPLTQAARSADALDVGGAGGGPPLVLEALPGLTPVTDRRDVALTALRLVWPLSGPLTQGFGPSPYWMEPAVRVGSVLYPHFHTGIDIAAPWGTAVAAAAPGVVEYTGWDGGYGLTVVLLHPGGLRTLYCHLSAATVHVGQRVTAGTAIAREGATGAATGPHLHFEVRPSLDVVADPMGFLAGGSSAPSAEHVRVGWSPTQG